MLARLPGRVVMEYLHFFLGYQTEWLTTFINLPTEDQQTTKTIIDWWDIPLGSPGLRFDYSTHWNCKGLYLVYTSSIFKDSNIQRLWYTGDRLSQFVHPLNVMFPFFPHKNQHQVDSEKQSHHARRSRLIWWMYI